MYRTAPTAKNYLIQNVNSADIKKNKIMPSAATWTDLDVIILSEVRQRMTNTI